MKRMLRFIEYLSISILLSAQIHSISGFSIRCNTGCVRKFTSIPKSALASSTDVTTFEVCLDKPMGLILTEVKENCPDGIIISEVSPSGSAYSSPYNSQLIGSKIMAVNTINVERLMFDDIMEIIALSDSPVNLTVQQTVDNISVVNSTATDESHVSKVELPQGTAVKLVISLAGESTSKIIDARVGENLRKTLLDNGIELYRGWKKKLGNCGGAGQCTFCAVQLDSSENWEPQSDYENSKIGRKMGVNGRLACLNNIQGPADIVITPP